MYSVHVLKTFGSCRGTAELVHWTKHILPKCFSTVAEHNFLVKNRFKASRSNMNSWYLYMIHVFTHLCLMGMLSKKHQRINLSKTPTPQFAARTSTRPWFPYHSKGPFSVMLLWLKWTSWTAFPIAPRKNCPKSTGGQKHHDVPGGRWSWKQFWS